MRTEAPALAEGTSQSCFVACVAAGGEQAPRWWAQRLSHQHGDALLSSLSPWRRPGKGRECGG